MFPLLFRLTRTFSAAAGPHIFEWGDYFTRGKAWLVRQKPPFPAGIGGSSMPVRGGLAASYNQ
jgi:hypothetical protein